MQGGRGSREKEGAEGKSDIHIPVVASEITDDAELLEFMRMRKKTNDRKKQI